MRLALILLLLVLPRLAGATPIETYYQTTDGADYAPAFERAQAACIGGACQVELGAAVYPLARPVDVCRAMRIVGVGTGFTNGGSVLQMNRKTAIRTWRGGQCPRPGFKGDGALVLEHVVLSSAPILALGQAGDPNEAPFFGLEQRARVALRDVGIRGFVQGIRQVCNKPDAICSASTFDSVDVEESEHTGIYVNGGDASASLFSRMRSDGACRNAPKWHWLNAHCGKYAAHRACTEERLRCAGITDASFLGNTWIGGATSTENGHAGVVIVGDSTASTVIGHYTEDNADPGYASPRANIVGGRNAFEGLGGQWHGSATPGITISHGGVGVQFGQETNMTGVIWSVQNATTGEQKWRYKINPLTGDLELDVGNKKPLRGYSPYLPAAP